ncbi:MAG TPA: ribonucleotide-diphosphate reductase subunit beta [Solirubrobacteraceae bacterium]|nr:ribonucleotide-diphosphate reductase subunit beta [Solirubrobacteraceae bacterium]
MAHLLDLTTQGDVGTLADPARLASVTLMDPQQLYELWERQPWSAHAIDLARDRQDWAALDPAERQDIAWSLASFYVGEERVTTQFSGLVMAYETQSEEAFLTTQQVDEARHAQHFDRFFDQVLRADDTFESRLEHARRGLSAEFVTLFDGHLVDAGRALVADPADVEAKVDFVVTYHMVIEGTLALTGQHFVTRALEERGILPGFVEGFRRVATDEHRHVAYGTWFLQQKATDPGLRRRIAERLMALLPVTAGVLVPPGADPADWTLLGYGAEEINHFAFTALTRRLKVIGVDLAAAAA